MSMSQHKSSEDLRSGLEEWTFLLQVATNCEVSPLSHVPHVNCAQAVPRVPYQVGVEIRDHL